MTEKELRNMQREFEDSGPDDKLKIWPELKLVLEKSIQRLVDTKDGQGEDYRKTLESWTGMPQAVARPLTIQGDLRAARIYYLAAFAGLLLEAMIATWLSNRNGINPIIGILIALIACVLIEALNYLLFNRPNKPKETLRKVKSWFAIPSSLLFACSFLVLLLARVASGELAVTLLPLFNLSVPTLTVGLLGMVGALLANRRILMWSANDESAYNLLEDRESAARGLLARLEHEVSEIKAALQAGQQPVQLPQQNVPRIATSGTHGAITPAILALVLLPFLSVTNSACYRTNANQPPSTIAVEQKVSMEVFSDVSGSLDNPAHKRVAQTIIENMPDVVESLSMRRAVVSTFANDGWNSSQTFASDFPPLTIPVPSKVERGEVGDQLDNVKKAIEDKEKGEFATQERTAREAYKGQISQKLTGFDERAFLPLPSSIEPPCTDLNGLFSRIAQSSKAEKTLYVVITDGEQGCGGREIKDIPMPDGQVALVVVLIPPQPEEMNIRQPSYTQFEQRKSEIIRAIPWATVIPYFTFSQDYRLVYEEALKKIDSRSVKTAD